MRVLKIQAQEDILDDSVREILGIPEDRPWQEYLYYIESSMKNGLRSMEETAVKIGLPMEKKESGGMVAYRVHDTLKDHLIFNWASPDGDPHIAGFFRPNGPMMELDRMGDAPWEKVTQ